MLFAGYSRTFGSSSPKHMTDFFALIHVNSEVLNFRFTRIFVVKGIKFFITVIDGHRHLVSFNMKRNGSNEWELIPPFPDWVSTIESDLARAIDLHF
jgi:hypothetical protein